MKNYWVITHPLSYRITEPIMNAAFEAVSFEGAFDSKEVPEEELEATVEKMRAGELAGLSVFTPHKGPSVALCDELSHEVQAIGAVNYMQMEDGKIHGYNIDWEGAKRAMNTVLPDLSGKKILVLGAGGAGRAVAYFAKQEGAEVYLWNRTPEKAEKFAAQIGVNFVEDLNDMSVHPEVIVNATRVSSQDRQRSLVPFALWEKVELAMESVCRATSLFLEEAKAMNVPHLIDGEDWAAHQMNALLKHIANQEISTDTMHEIVHKALA
jgi:shikimate dehydrogenase